jgi:ribonuclease BN (tRNA processing enzyme)
MELTFLGSGSAFVLSKENYHSNILITDKNTNANCLYDVGTTIPDALNDMGLTPLDIQSIFISHNHSDHAGGMEYMGFKTYFTFPFGTHKPELYGHYHVLDELWDNNLKSGMRSIQGQTANMDTYFEVKYLRDSDFFNIGQIRAYIVQTIHVIDDRRFMPTYGLMLNDTSSDKNIFITGDSQLAPNQMMSFYQKADVIFHDCECKKYPNSVHAQYHELCGLPAEIKAKMWLYHYTTDGGTIELPNACEDGFLGFVKRGESFVY